MERFDFLMERFSVGHGAQSRLAAALHLLHQLRQLFTEARGLGFGDIRSFPDLYKSGNDLTAYSSIALDAPKRIRGGGSNRLISSTCPP